MPTCPHVHKWICAWAWIYLYVYVCACGCLRWCLFCAPLLMHRHSRLYWLLRPADYCCEEWPTATHWGKNFSNQQESSCSTLRSNMFNCLWCSLAPTAEGPGGQRQVQGLTFPFHSQLHSHIDWEIYQCSSLQHCSNYQTQTKLEPLSPGIGTLYPLETVKHLMHWILQKWVKCTENEAFYSLMINV